MPGRIVFLITTLLGFGFSIENAFAETRVALVIGNGAYQNAPGLRNPRNDADDVAGALKRNGFEVILGIDLTQSGMHEIAIRFARAARVADVAIFYYSGHAIQFAGVNYLAPVDIKLVDEADLRRMVKVDEITDDLQQAKNVRILVLDSCRDNPLADQLKRSIGPKRGISIQRGLAKIDSSEGMIVAYATQAGRTADDGDGRNSPYTSAFLKHIDENEEIGTVFRRISADVFRTTNRAQLPELSLSFIGEFYLRGKPLMAAIPPNQAPLPTVPNALREVNIPGGLTSEQIVRLLREDDSLTGSIQDTPPEGSLLPNKYQVSPETTRDQILLLMQEAQRRYLKDVWYRRRPSPQIATPAHLVILASILEREASKPEERSRMAGVFVNRLRQRMKLQSDATLIYGLVGGKGDLGRPMRRSEITQPTPYNTYLIEGLPPGPIVNPSAASLEAAANPVPSKELFFSSDGKGGHLFAETYDQHKNNQKNLRQ